MVPGPIRQPASVRLSQFLRISRLLAGQTDFGSAIAAVGDEVARIVPFDHLDVCIVGADGGLHTAYEVGIDTGWGTMDGAPVGKSPIAPLLAGQVDHMLTGDACADPGLDPANPAHRPIFEHRLRSRINLPLTVHGEIIGALSCSLHEADLYGPADVRNARYIAELLAPYLYVLRAAEITRAAGLVEAAARAREEGLRLGAQQLTEALEGERQRIGMDLHDQTLADLTRITRSLDRLRQSGAADDAVLGDLSIGLQGAMAALRQIIETAKPSVLQLFGFVHAVENHLDRAIRDSGQPIRAVLTDRSGTAVDALDNAAALALFRIVQEAVNNAVLHAQASTISVALEEVEGCLMIAVSDDGIGLSTAERLGTTGGGGHGIGNMRTRARLIPARFRIGQGAQGRGTRVEISLPQPVALVRSQEIRR